MRQKKKKKGVRWEITGNVLIRVSDSEEESSEQRAKNKSFPHHWDKTQLNMHAEKWKFDGIGGAEWWKTVAKSQCGVSDLLIVILV